MTDPKETTEQEVERLEKVYAGLLTPKAGDMYAAIRHVQSLEAENAKLRDEVADWRQSAKSAALESCDDDRVHCTCVGPLRAENTKLRAERDEAVGAVKRMAYENCDGCGAVNKCARAGSCLWVEQHAVPAKSGRDAVETVAAKFLAKHRQQAGEASDGP